MERSRFIGIQLDESGNRRSRKTPNGRKHRWAAAYLVKDHCVGTERNDFGHLVERVNRWIVSGSRLLKTHLPPYQAAPLHRAGARYRSRRPSVPAIDGPAGRDRLLAQ